MNQDTDRAVAANPQELRELLAKILLDAREDWIQQGFQPGMGHGRDEWEHTDEGTRDEYRYMATAAIAALTAPSPEPARATAPEAVRGPEAVWLIERGQGEMHSPTVWWAGGNGADARWTTDANEAVKFDEASCKRVIAERSPTQRLAFGRAVEHIFVKRPDTPDYANFHAAVAQPALAPLSVEQAVAAVHAYVFGKTGCSLDPEMLEQIIGRVALGPHSEPALLLVTWDDVSLLRKLSGWASGEDGQTWYVALDLEDLAVRMAAVLPPRD